MALLPYYIVYETFGIAPLVMMPLTFGATCVLVYYALRKGLLFFYLRLILAVMIMLLCYVCMISSAAFILPTHNYNIYNFHAIMRQTLT